MTTLEQLILPGRPFELTRTGPDGTGGLVYRNAPGSLRAVLLEASAIADDRDYVVCEDRHLSSRDHDRQTRRLAAHLHGPLGLRRGDRVALASRNLPEFSVAFWACQAIGVVVVPLNAWWSGPELAASVRHSGSRVLIADAVRWERLAPLRAELDLDAVLVTSADLTEPRPAPEGTEDLDELLRGPEVAGYPEVEVGSDDLSTIVYTSGTTGSPKGAVHTHGNYCSAVMNNRLTVEVARLDHAERTGTEVVSDEQDAMLLTYPLFHIAGLVNLCLSVGAHWTKFVLMRRWDAERAADAILDEHVTVALLVPTTLRSLLAECGERLAADPRLALRTVAAGGASVPGELIDQLGELYGGTVFPGSGYGLTETTAGAIAFGGPDYIAHPTSVGRPMPSLEVRIVGADGADAPTGTVGEIVLRGPSVCHGYWRNPEETSKAFEDGWFHTGDLGKVDEDGLYYVVDRIKEVIIRGGENIFSPEVEATLETHPDVLEAAVIGLPDEQYGESVGAVVRTRATSEVDEAALRAYVGDRLAYFKVPGRIAVVRGELPRTASGKVVKRDLRPLLATPLPNPPA